MKEEWVTLVALKEATSQALTEQEENSAPAVNEDEEEDHAEREWVKLCTLKDLEGRIEEMLDEHVIVPTRWEGLRDERLRRGSVEPLVESVKAVEKRREAPSPRKGILRAKTDDLIVRKKKSVRFEEERARSESDEPVVIKKKKTVRFSDSEDEGSGRQSRTAWYEVEGSNLWR